MGKQTWKPGNMLYPLPAVFVTVQDQEGKDNIFTVAWAGTICTNPPMVSISVRPERYSYRFLEENGDFVINLATEELCWALDYCGVVSGRDKDKFNECHLEKMPAEIVRASMLKKSPVNMECRTVEKHKLGSHVMFMAKVMAVHADEQYMDQTGKFSLKNANLIVYSHGTYFSLGNKIGTFGYSIRKKTDRKNEQKKSRRK